MTAPLGNHFTNKAPTLFLSLLVTVLGALFLETRGPLKRNTNFYLAGDSDVVGAEIFMDGSHKGKIKIASNSGLSGGVFHCHLSNGTHQLEIRKPGFKTVSLVLNFRGQDYLGINLERTN